MSYGYLTRSSGYKMGPSHGWVDKKPVPPLSEYEAFGKSKPRFNASRWRRLVILMRNGETFGGACNSMGFEMDRTTYSKMPEHLK